jgi:hypothetical protein
MPFLHATVSVHTKRELFRIVIEGLQAHLHKNNLVMAKKVFTQAVDYS